MGERRLLVCDDEPAIGRLVRNVAEGLGFAVEVASDGHACIRTYDLFKPTTIMLDMIMPGMDGNEVIGRLAARQCTARLIIMTGYAPDYAEHAKVLAEFKGLKTVTSIRKPVDVAALRRILAADDA